MEDRLFYNIIKGDPFLKNILVRHTIRGVLLSAVWWSEPTRTVDGEGDDTTRYSGRQEESSTPRTSPHCDVRHGTRRVWVYRSEPDLLKSLALHYSYWGCSIKWWLINKKMVLIGRCISDGWCEHSVTKR